MVQTSEGLQGPFFLLVVGCVFVGRMCVCVFELAAASAVALQGACVAIARPLRVPYIYLLYTYVYIEHIGRAVGYKRKCLYAFRGPSI